MPVSDMQRYAELVRSGGRRGRAPRAPAASPRGGAPSAGSPAGMPQAAQLEDRHLLAPGPRNADAGIRTRRAEMRTTKLGDLTVSAQGLGCMGMSEWYGAADWDESIATIHAALDAGVTFLDTADAYGAGHNEVLVGRAIAHRRDEVQLATKFGIDRSGADGKARVLRRRAVLRQAGGRVQPGPARGRGHRPVLPAPAAADGRDRGDRRRDGRAGRRGQGPLPRPVRGQQRPAAPRLRGAPDHRRAERVLAVDAGTSRPTSSTPCGSSTSGWCPTRRSAAAS